MDRGVTQPMRGRRHLAVFVLENAEAVKQVVQPRAVVHAEPFAHVTTLPLPLTVHE